MTEGKPKAKIGRPSDYTEDRAFIFCQYIANGMSMRSACRQDDMPEPATIFKWMRDHDEFLKRYEKATVERTEALAEEILDIADDSDHDYIETEDGHERLNGENIQRARLRVDTRKWIMAKMKPKKYGDKLDVTSGGEKLPAPLLGGVAPKTDA